MKFQKYEEKQFPLSPFSSQENQFFSTFLTTIPPQAEYNFVAYSTVKKLMKESSLPLETLQIIIQNAQLNNYGQKGITYEEVKKIFRGITLAQNSIQPTIKHIYQGLNNKLKTKVPCFYNNFIATNQGAKFNFFDKNNDANHQRKQKTFSVETGFHNKQAISMISEKNNRLKQNLNETQMDLSFRTDKTKSVSRSNHNIKNFTKIQASNLSSSTKNLKASTQKHLKSETKYRILQPSTNQKQNFQKYWDRLGLKQGKIGGQKVKKLIESKTKKQILFKAWNLCCIKQRGFLTKGELYLFLKLVNASSKGAILPQKLEVSHLEAIKIFDQTDQNSFIKDDFHLPETSKILVQSSKNMLFFKSQTDDTQILLTKFRQQQQRLIQKLQAKDKKIQSQQQQIKLLQNSLQRSMQLLSRMSLRLQSQHQQQERILNELQDCRKKQEKVENTVLESNNKINKLFDKNKHQYFEDKTKQNGTTFQSKQQENKSSDSSNKIESNIKNSVSLYHSDGFLKKKHFDKLNRSKFKKLRFSAYQKDSDNDDIEQNLTQLESNIAATPQEKVSLDGVKLNSLQIKTLRLINAISPIKPQEYQKYVSKVIQMNQSKLLELSQKLTEKYKNIKLQKQEKNKTPPSTHAFQLEKQKNNSDPKILTHTTEQFKLQADSDQQFEIQSNENLTQHEIQ